MERNNAQSDTEWRNQYDAAHSMLEDVKALALYQQIVDRCDPAAPPTAHIFAHPEIARRARRVCLLAGSFNPLTQAHVAVAEAARNAAHLDVIIWVLTKVTIDKERVARASLPDRLGQLSAYIENAPQAGGNLLALLNRGLYVDQATAIRQLLDANAHLCMLVGFDKIVQILDPHYYSDREAALRALFAQAKLLVAPRAGAGEAELEALLVRPENAPYRHHVKFIPMPPEYQDESSTEVRALAARHDSASSKILSRLVTPEGLALIDTGAYVPVVTTGNVDIPDVDNITDAYLWRQTWIRAFARTRSPILLDNLPPLSTLVAYTVAPDKRGATIRRRLARIITAPPEQVRRLLRTLLAKIS
ncbi:MAG TPA: hypothetical protein VF510_03510 [Ktedonobacterales bacterium]